MAHRFGQAIIGRSICQAGQLFETCKIGCDCIGKPPMELRHERLQDVSLIDVAIYINEAVEMNGELIRHIATVGCVCNTHSTSS
jgi:hypothetical protein